MIRRIEVWFRNLARVQVARPWAFIFVAWALAAASVPFIARLELHSSWTSLLPTDKPSVVDMERVGRRVGGLTTLSIALESRDLDAMQRFVRVLVPRLERLGPPVRTVDWNMSAYADFVRENRYLYASIEELEEVRDSLQERLTYERARANPFFVQLDDEVPADPRETIRRVEARAEASSTRATPGGFYVHPDGDLLVVFVRADASSGSSSALRKLTRDVASTVNSLRPRDFASDMRVSYAGSAISSREEHVAIENELKFATTLSVVLVLGLLWGFFRTVRSMPLIGFGLSVPVLMTFAFTQLAIGHLNTSTAFLGSIVVGNGVNPFIVWLARFVEERRRGLGLEDAVAATHAGAWQGTLAASLAASVAYGSLMVTDFRGFRDFGIIGFVGMVLCWLGSALLLPAATVVLERAKPMPAKALEASKPWFGRHLAAVVFARPRTIVAVASVLALVSFLPIVAAIRRGPFELDFRKLRSESDAADVSRVLGDRIKEIMGPGNSESNVYIVLDDRAQVAALRDRLVRMRDEASAPWGAVRTLDDLLPTDQEAKLGTLEEIREVLDQYRRYADEELLAAIDEHAPSESLRVLTLEDLPATTARLYSERDGTRGRILVVTRQRGRTIWDGAYLVEWANALRTVRLQNGERPPLAGTAPVFADMIESIVTDGPKAVFAALGVTIALLLVTFGRMRERIIVLVTLLVGMVWMTGILASLGTKLNFLNFVAFPITCGVGADYGVNVMKRYVLDSPRGAFVAIRAAIEDSGGAVILCSLTTIVGYGTLLVSSNAALRSFGLAMSVSEVTCLFAAIVFLPAWLVATTKSRSEAPE